MLVVLVLAFASVGAAPVDANAGANADANADGRLVLQAPNLYGQQGLLRTTSALSGRTGSGSLGVQTRLFVSPDFLLDDVTDANTFLEGNVVAGFGFFEVAELAIQMRAAANLNSARAQPATSVGDTTISLKGGYSFGLVAAAAHYRVGLATRANKVGFDLENVASTFGADVTIDLTTLDVPLRLHLNGGYTAQPGQLADNGKAKFLLDGPDGALLALASQQWFFDHASGGLGVEVPLPYVSPFVELWYEAVVATDGYDYGTDSWLIVTPGVRLGFGGLRVDLGVDLGLLGNAGGGAPVADQLFDGQPLNPLWAARIGVSHSFDLGGGGGGGGSFDRLQGCVVDDAGPVKNAVVAVSVDGQPGPRLLTDDQGCIDAPVQPGAWTVTASDDDHAAVTAAVARGTPATIKLVAQPRVGRLAGFVTNKEDESIDVQLSVKDGGGSSWRDVGSSAGGTFDVEVKSGPVVAIARADGYLTQGARRYVASGAREGHTFVMRKVPKKRSATLTDAKIETAARVPFEFKKPRMLSTAEYLLDELADLVLSNPALRLSIQAHTDPLEVADASEAKALTERRAAAVKLALMERGVDADRLETEGFGISQPIAPNDPKNRRVELLVIK